MAASGRNMQLIAVYHKGAEIKFVSHLDIQRALHRALMRANVPISYSQGFNPHPKLSFASALSTGASSDAEWFAVELEGQMSPEAFCDAVNARMPAGFFLSDVMEAPDKMGSLSALTRAAEYVITLRLDRVFASETVQSAIDALLSGPIVVRKRTKSGERDADIRPDINRVSVERIEGNEITLRVLGRLQADGGLRADTFVGALLDRLDAHGDCAIHRAAMYFAEDGPLPRLPLE